MKVNRPLSLMLGRTTLLFPTFFPAISTVKTNLSPSQYLQVLAASGFPQYLVSAYDIVNSDKGERIRIINSLKESHRNNQIILLDSGNYESFWKRDREWKISSYNKILPHLSFNLAFCFDDQAPPKSSIRTINIIENSVLSNQSKAKEGTILPIVHASLNTLPEVVLGVAKKLRPLLIAVPERLLGDGIISRINNLIKIRKKLNTIGEYIPIHLLGTGNPRSILLYSIFGADSFDGLEWCQTTVDHQTGLLYHFQQREFFNGQVKLELLKDLPYTQSTLLHNLLFYKDFISKLQIANKDGNLINLAEQYFDKKFFNYLKETYAKTTQR